MAEKFQFLEKIGEGAFASVYKVRRHEDQSIYAFKKIKTTITSEKQIQNSLNEIRILASVKSPYVIAYKQAFYDSNMKCFCLITEFVEGCDLSRKIQHMYRRKELLKEEEIWKITIQLLCAIKHLHSLQILHRDIKPANILLSKFNSQVKLADMNVSVISKSGLACTQTGTPYYTSPQVWMNRVYNGKSDIWSLGCVIHQMASQKAPFVASDIQNLKRRVIQSDFPRIPAQYSAQLQAIIRLCLQKDPSRRPSAKQLLDLPIVQQKLKDLKQTIPLKLPIIDGKHSSVLVDTIRLNNNCNANYLKIKLPKCNYISSEDNKQNCLMGKNIKQNRSCVTKRQQNAQMEVNFPKIKRSESTNKNVKSQKMRVEKILKIRA